MRKGYCILSPEKQEDVISSYASGIGCVRISKLLGVSHTTVLNMLKRRGVERKSKTEYRKNATDESFFGVIDVEEKAYFLGLMFSDGLNYGGKKRYFSIELREDDAYILERFSLALCPNTPKELYFRDRVTPTSKETHRYARLTVYSKKICEDLDRLGCMPNKSVLLKFPSYLRPNLLRHFMRGYFDGDGSISLTGSVSITSSHLFCQECSQFLLENLHVKSEVYPRKNYSTISIHQQSSASIFLRWIYKDFDETLCLRRKYERYKNFVTVVTSRGSDNHDSVWALDEYQILVNNLGLATAQLTALIPTRTASAIKIMRNRAKLKLDKEIKSGK
jgi:intein/homing endonuclease